jgi:hypothetical protein
MKISNILKLFPVIAILATFCQISPSTAATYRWSWWASEDYSVIGSFTTPKTTGLVTEADLTSHTFIAFKSGVPIFNVDLVNSKLTVDGVTTNALKSLQDIQYTIGENSFIYNPVGASNPKYPIDFTVLNSDNPKNVYTGFYYYDDTEPELGIEPGWYLQKPPSEIQIRLTVAPERLVASSFGFTSGPVVTEVPEPLTILGSVAALGIGAYAERKRKLSESSEKDNTKDS